MYLTKRRGKKGCPTCNSFEKKRVLWSEGGCDMMKKAA
jgi:hypothetical protein